MKMIPAVCATVLSMVSLFRASADSSTVAVSFDANGGELEDAIRVVKIGGTFGQNVNLYPSDSTENFSEMASDRLTLADGVFTYETSSARWSNFWTKPIENIFENRPYTYVIDILTYENAASAAPWFNVGATGGDQPSQLSGAWKQVQGTGRMVFESRGRMGRARSAFDTGRFRNVFHGNRTVRRRRQSVL